MLNFCQFSMDMPWTFKRQKRTSFTDLWTSHSSKTMESSILMDTLWTYCGHHGHGHFYQTYNLLKLIRKFGRFFVLTLTPPSHR